MAGALGAAATGAGRGLASIIGGFGAFDGLASTGPAWSSFFLASPSPPSRLSLLRLGSLPPSPIAPATAASNMRGFSIGRRRSFPLSWVAGASEGVAVDGIGAAFGFSIAVTDGAGVVVESAACGFFGLGRDCGFPAAGPVGAVGGTAVLFTACSVLSAFLLAGDLFSASAMPKVPAATGFLENSVGSSSLSLSLPLA